jgi:hypothetical protein
VSVAWRWTVSVAASLSIDSGLVTSQSSVTARARADAMSRDLGASPLCSSPRSAVCPTTTGTDCDTVGPCLRWLSNRQCVCGGRMRRRDIEASPAAAGTGPLPRPRRFA